MKKFEGKTIVITGAASGIGRALAFAFADRKAKLSLCDTNEADLQAVEEKIRKQGVDVWAEAVDVADFEQMKSFAQNTKNHFARVDAVINNAGVALGKLTIEETSIEEFNWLMNINLGGVLHGTKAFLPFLKEEGKEAAIVNISSIFGLMGVGFNGAYSASKFAVRGFSESLAIELEETAIQVLSVHPSGIKTNIAINARGGDKVEAARFSEQFLKDSPDKIAQKIIRAIEQKKVRVMVGRGATIVDWMNRLIPYKLAAFLQRKAMKR